MSKEGGGSTSTISRGPTSSTRGLSSLRSSSIPLAHFKAPSPRPIKQLSASEIRSFSKPSAPTKLDKLFGPKLDLRRPISPSTAPKVRILDRKLISPFTQPVLPLLKINLNKAPSPYTPNIERYQQSSFKSVTNQLAKSENNPQNSPSKFLFQKPESLGINILQPTKKPQSLSYITDIQKGIPNNLYKEAATKFITHRLANPSLGQKEITTSPTISKDLPKSLIEKPQFKLPSRDQLDKIIAISKTEPSTMVASFKKSLKKNPQSRLLTPIERQQIFNRLINQTIQQEISDPINKPRVITISETKADLLQATKTTQQLIKAGISPEAAQILVSRSLKSEFLKTAYKLKQSEKTEVDDENIIVATLVKLKINEYLKRQVVKTTIQRHLPTEQNRYQTWRILAEQQGSTEYPISGQEIIKSLPSRRPDALISPMLLPNNYDGLLEDSHKEISKRYYGSLSEAENHFQSLLDQHPAAEVVETVTTELLSESQIQRIVRGKLSRQELDQLLTEMASTMGFSHLRFF